MALVWSLVVFVHVLAATFWVGGQLMLAFVVMPLLRRTVRPEITGEVAKLSGRRFAKIANFGLLPVLVATGVILAWHDGVRMDNLNGTVFGHVLEIKVIVVALVIALAGAHGLVARRFSRRGVRGLAILTMALSIVILLFAGALAVLPAP